MTVRELVEAIALEDYSTARDMLDRGLKVNSGGTWGYNTGTPLSYAINASNGKALKFLLAHGADPNYQCQIDGIDVQLPVFQAAGKANVDILKILVQHGANLLQQNTDDGSLAIHRTVEYAPDNFHYLIDGCNTEIALRQLYAHDHSGRTLLSYVNDLLMSKTAQPSQPRRFWRSEDYDRLNKTILALKDMSKHISKKIITLERLFLSADSGDVEEMVKCMTQDDIVDHADVNRRNQVGETALHCASRTGQMAAIKFLLEDHKANRMVANDRGSLPLHLAARWNQTRVVRSLLTETDAEPELVARQLGARDVEGHTPADVCRQYNHHELGDYLDKLEEPKEEQALLPKASANDSVQDSTTAAPQRAETPHKPSILDQLVERLRIAEEQISTLAAVNTRLSTLEDQIGTLAAENTRLSTLDAEIARLSALKVDSARLSTFKAENVGLSTRLTSSEAEDTRLATQVCELTKNCSAVDQQSASDRDAVCAAGSNYGVSSDCYNYLNKALSHFGDLGTVLTGRLERMEARMDSQ